MLVGVDVCDGVRVVVGLAVREVVELKEGVAVTLGVGVCVGEGVGRLHVAELPEPACRKPVPHTHERPGPVPKV